MGKIEDALHSLRGVEDPTARARELAGLLSTLFKLRGVALIVLGDLALSTYTNTQLDRPELELTALAGKLTPRLLQEIMSGQLDAGGSIGRWTVVDIPVRFYTEAPLLLRELCRDFRTDHGFVKLWPAEEITAERIVAAVYPVPNPVAHEQALALLMNGLSDAFHMDWIALRKLCYLPEYRVGEELAQLRTEAKQQADILGMMLDPVGYIPKAGLETSSLPRPGSGALIDVAAEAANLYP
jgi:hypothetical protein